MRQFFIFISLLTLIGCSQEQDEYVFVPAPKTPAPKALNPEFENWEAWQAEFTSGADEKLFLESGKGYLSLSFQSPKPIYSVAPTVNERLKLGAELLHHCRSERGKDQLKWIADWSLGRKLTNSLDFVRLLVRYETKPQGEADRQIYGYEARYALEDGTCGELVSLSDKKYSANDYIQFFE